MKEDSVEVSPACPRLENCTRLNFDISTSRHEGHICPNSVVLASCATGSRTIVHTNLGPIIISIIPTQIDFARSKNRFARAEPPRPAEGAGRRLQLDPPGREEQGEPTADAGVPCQAGLCQGVR